MMDLADEGLAREDSHVPVQLSKTAERIVIFPPPRQSTSWSFQTLFRVRSLPHRPVLVLQVCDSHLIVNGHRAALWPVIECPPHLGVGLDIREPAEVDFGFAAAKEQ